MLLAPLRGGDPRRQSHHSLDFVVLDHVVMRSAPSHRWLRRVKELPAQRGGSGGAFCGAQCLTGLSRKLHPVQLLSIEITLKNTKA